MYPPSAETPNLVRTGSMFAACRAWIEGNLQPSSASRGYRFLQAGEREKTPVGKKCQPQNHREISSAEPPKRFHVCSVQSMDRRKPVTFFSEQEWEIPAGWGERKKPSEKKCQLQNHRKMLVVRYRRRGLLCLVYELSFFLPNPQRYMLNYSCESALGVGIVFCCLVELM